MSSRAVEEKEQEPTTDLNVVILPDDASIQHLIAISVLASRNPTHFTLDTHNYLPHLSVFSGRYPKRNVNRLVETVAQLARQSAAFPITLSALTVYAKTFLFFNADQSEHLKGFHKAALDLLNQLREGYVPDNVTKLTGLTTAQKESIRLYGNPSAGATYTPHITITRFLDSAHAREAARSLSVTPITFMASQTAIASFATHGTCPQPIHRFPLGR